VVVQLCPCCVRGSVGGCAAMSLLCKRFSGWCAEKMKNRASWFGCMQMSFTSYITGGDFLPRNIKYITNLTTMLYVSFTSVLYTDWQL
jgi:hypothetical protein